MHNIQPTQQAVPLITSTKSRWLRILLIGIFILIITGGGYTVIRLLVQQDLQKANAMTKAAYLPHPLPFYALTPTPQQLGRTQYTCLFYFDPECDHCMYEAQAIQRNIQAFQSTQLIGVSTADTASILRFARHYQLLDLPNVQWMADTARAFQHVFGQSLVPSVWIYDHTGELLKHYQGETKPEALLKHLNDGL